MHTVYLGLGSNLGGRLAYLSDAVEQLQAFMNIEAVSSIYETEPVGMDSQDMFLNMVLKGSTELLPGILLSKVKEIEERLGRTPGTHTKPREIDIDILLYDSIVYLEHSLDIPHPRMAERRFVLLPLAEIAPDILHPIFNRTIRELLSACRETGKVNKTDLKLTIHQLS